MSELKKEKRFKKIPSFITTGPLGSITDYLLIIAGALLNAAALQLLLIPNDVVAGGITGLAVIAHIVTGLPFTIFLLAFNLPLLLVQWKLLGGIQIFLRTLVGVVTLALATDLFAGILPVMTNDRLLVISYGGVMSGVGLGLVFKGRGTTGGADILGRICYRYFGWSIGRTLLLINLLVYGLAAALFGPEPAMVAFLLSFVMSFSLDGVLHGLTGSRVALIVTKNPEIVREAIINSLGRGLTLIPAEGGRSGSPQKLLYVVFPRSEAQRLKLRVLTADPGSFITIITPKESVGGFNLSPPV